MTKKKKRAITPKTALVDGYQLAAEILAAGGVEALITFAQCDAKDETKETLWLEFKAGMSSRVKKPGENDDDAFWHVAKAVIAMANASGGAIIVGAQDRTGVAVGLQENDLRDVISKKGLQAYIVDEIATRITKNTWSTGRDGNWKIGSDYTLEGKFEVHHANYKNKDVAVVLVRAMPRGKRQCIRVLHNRVEKILFRSSASGCHTAEVELSGPMDQHDKGRQITDFTSLLKRFRAKGASQQLPAPQRRHNSNMPPKYLTAEGIQQAVRDGVFTPLLGPLCYKPLNQRAGLGHILANVDALKQALNGTDRNVADHYLQTLIDSRIPKASANKALQSPHAQVDDDNPLRMLQCELVSAGVAACRLFGKYMSGQTPSGMTDLQEYSIVYDAALSPDWSRLCNTLCKASLAAKRVGDSRQFECAREDDSSPCLGAVNIGEQLVSLTLRIFGQDYLEGLTEPSIVKWRTEFYAELVIAANREGQTDPQLFLRQLEWLGDLLWHTLRFDAPMFPLPDELAFHLSLCAGCRTPSRVRLGVATTSLVATTSVEDALGCVQRIFHHCNSVIPAPDNDDLYSAIVKALVSMSRKDTSEQITPLILSSNFDRQLERALEMMEDQRHFVAFPVKINTPIRLKPEDYHSWIVADRKGATLLNWRLEHYAGGVIPPKEQIMLVKINGSPLESLPNDKDTKQLIFPQGSELKDLWEKGQLGFSHRVRFTDKHLLEALMATQKLPDFVLNSLPQNHTTRANDEETTYRRILYFIGYTLSSPSGMDLIQHHACLIRCDGNNDAPFKAMVEPPSDDYSKAVMQDFRIESSDVTNLEVLCALLSKAAKLSKTSIRRSENHADKN